MKGHLCGDVFFVPKVQKRRGTAEKPSGTERRTYMIEREGVSSRGPRTGNHGQTGRPQALVTSETRERRKLPEPAAVQVTKMRMEWRGVRELQLRHTIHHTAQLSI